MNWTKGWILKSDSLVQILLIIRQVLVTTILKTIEIIENFVLRAWNIADGRESFADLPEGHYIESCLSCAKLRQFPSSTATMKSWRRGRWLVFSAVQFLFFFQWPRRATMPSNFRLSLTEIILRVLFDKWGVSLSYNESLIYIQKVHFLLLLLMDYLRWES